MSVFPLYDSLLSSAEDKDLTTAQKKEFLKAVERIDQKGCEYIYILIKMYAQNMEKEYKDYTIPYGGKYLGIDIQFNIESFPPILKQMIFKFVDTHLKSMKENEEQSKRASIAARVGITDFEGVLN